MQEQDIRDILYRSLDESLSAAESQQLEAALANSASLRQEKEELLLLRAELAGLRQQPSVSFSQQLMQKLPQRGGLTARIQRLWPAVAAACLLTFAVGLGNIFYAEGSLDSQALIGVDDDLLPEDVLVLGDY